MEFDIYILYKYFVVYFNKFEAFRHTQKICKSPKS